MTTEHKVLFPKRTKNIMVESLVLHADFAQLPHLYLAKKRYYLFTEFVNRIILYSVKDADSLPSFYFLCESLM